MIIGLSDGVDSAVAAWMLKKQGYIVHALYLDIAGTKEKNAAEESAGLLGIPFTACDVRNELKEKVFMPFAKGYLEGRTVNPCVLCNPLVKLKALEREADKQGAQYIATGHYVFRDGQALYRGHPDHDQSYMLCRIQKEQLQKLLLPLGRMNKAEVRRIAGRIGFPAAKKPDSRDLCLLPRDLPYWQWIENKWDCPGPGEILLDGKTIGCHNGIHRYTLGMRLPYEKDGRYLYVKSIDAAGNLLEAGVWESLFTRKVLLSSLCFLDEPPQSPFRGEIRVRHTRHETPACTVELFPGGAMVTADSAFRSPCPGQAAALYIGNRLIGSGIVEKGIYEE